MVNTFLLKRRLWILLGVLVFATSLVASLHLLSVRMFAQTVGSTQQGTITFYGVGWSANTVRVQTTAPPMNPGSCTGTDGYMTNPSDSGNQAYQAALLSAFLAGKNVVLILQGCTSNRPQIIGVYVYP
jgi:hypothetical protein